MVCRPLGGTGIRMTGLGPGCRQGKATYVGDGEGAGVARRWRALVV